MLQALGPFRPVLLAALFLMTGHGLTSTILSARLAQLGASAQIAGLVTTAYFVGMVVGSRFGSRLLQRTGHIRGFAATVTLAAISVLLVPVVSDPFAWMALRFVGGFSIALALLILESWLNIEADNTTRGSVFGAYMVVAYVGMTGGQALLGVFDIGSYEVFSVAAIAMMLAVQPMVFTVQAQPILPPMARLRLMDLLRISPVGIAATVAAGGLTGAMFGLFPYFASSSGLDTGGIAVFMSSVIGGGLILNWPLGWLSDRIDRRWVIALAAGAILATSALLLAGDQSLVNLVVAGGIMGGATAALYSLGVAHTNDYVGGVDAIAVGAGLLLAFGVGAIVGPYFASAAMDIVGPYALFAYTGAIGGALMLLALYRMLARQAVASDDKTSFVSLSSTTPMAYGLDPWNAEEPADDGAADAPT